MIWHPASADGKEAAYISLVYPNGVELHCNRPPQLRPADTKATVSSDRGITIRGDGMTINPQPVPSYRGSGGIYGDFIECVKTRERPFRDLELCVNTMTAPHMVAIAQRLERSLEWDRSAQRFMNDEEANRLLDRARREPWTL